MSATDMDYGPDGQIRYSISSGNNERKFRINEISGDVFINAPIDFEHTSIFHLEILANDKPLYLANQHQAICHMDIPVIDVNDNRPVFDKMSYYSKIMETAEKGSDVIRVKATDQDSGTNGDVHYSITSGNQLGFFFIDALSGVITTKQSLDLETQQHVNDLIYILHVLAIDNGSPSLSGTVVVTIEIISVNEFKPKLLQPESMYVRIQSNSSLGSRVLGINATDRDFGIDGSLTYTLTDGNDNDTFNIDKNTGTITIAKHLRYQSMPRYYLVVKVTDGLPYHLRHSLVARVTIRLVTALDKGGQDIHILGYQQQITCPGNLVETVGINTSTSFNIEMVYQDGDESQVLDINDKRVALDDKFLSHGLFTVTKGNGRWTIQTTNPCHYGEGVLIVQVKGVNSLHVRISVVGYSSLVLQVISQQRLDANLTYTSIAEFHRLGSTNSSFEQADLRLFLKLTDNSQYEIPLSKMISFHVTTNDINIKVKLAGQQLAIDKTTSLGQFSIVGTFQNLSSQSVILRIVNKVLVAIEIISLSVPGLVNNTLLGVARKTLRQVAVTMTMDDASVMRVNDFHIFPGLVRFACKSCHGAMVDSATGLITLEKDSWSKERLIVSDPNVISDYQWMDFYCNTQPRPGGVDIGSHTGLAITSYTNPIPIYINTTGFTLLAYNITIIIHNPQLLKLKNLNNNIPYDIVGHQVTLADVIGQDDSNIHHVTDLIFSVSGYDTIGQAMLGVKSSTVIDNQLNFFPTNRSRRTCHGKSHVLGDIDQCGNLDIYDAAVTMLCAKNNRCEQYSKDQMDFNKNGLVEESDARLLTRASVNQAFFIKYLEIIKPNHTTRSCIFSIRTSLVTKENKTASQTDAQVFIEFISKKPTINSQLTRTVFNKGKLVSLYGNHDGLWRGIVKLQYNKEGEFELDSSESHLEQHSLGITMIQVIKKSTDVLYSVVPFYSSPHEPLNTSAVDIMIAPNIHLQATQSHSPQLLVDVQESMPSCIDPFISKTINMTFKSHFSAIVNIQEQFKIAIQADLMKRFPNVSITKVNISPGSIKVGFLAKAKATTLDLFIISLWRLLQTGYTLKLGDVTFVAAKTLLVNGHQILETTPQTSFPVAAVITTCVALVMLLVLAGLLICFRHHFYSNNKWIKIKKMTRMESRSSLHHYDNSQEQEMTFMGCHLSQSHLPGTPDMTRISKSNRPESAISSSSLTQRSKRVGSAKVSPALIPAQRSISKQNSGSRLIKDESESGSSTPELEQEMNGRQLWRTLHFNIDKSLMDNDQLSPKQGTGLAYAKRLHVANKEPLTRQSSDSRLMSTRGSPLTRPILHKKKTWTSQTTPDYGLFLSADSSPFHSGSTTPNKDSLAITPSYVEVLHDDLKLQDEPFTLRLPVNVLNTSSDGKPGPFIKLGFVEVQSDSSLTALRHAIMSSFELKHFVFEDSHMMDVPLSSEDNITVEDIFTLSVIIRNIVIEDEINGLFCICNKVAQFQCSPCNQRGYCGQDCLRKDWDGHKKLRHNQSESTL